MDQGAQAQVTTSDREHNPKAVFFGTLSTVINPLALYLDSHNVELFSGKSLNDAFFGDYFFYVGTLDSVKTFLESHGRQLPKTLLLCPPVSEYQPDEDTLTKLGQIKLVWLPENESLDEKQVERIIEFFYGSPRSVLVFGPPKKSTPIALITEPEKETEVEKKKDISFASLPVLEEEPPPATKMEEPKTKEPEKLPEKVVPTIKSETEQIIPADLTPQEAELDDFEKKIKNLYGNQVPKQTGNTPLPPRRHMPLLPAAIMGLIFFLFFPLFSLAAELGLLSLYLTQGRHAMLRGEFKQSQSYFKTAGTLGSMAQKNAELFAGLAAVTGQTETLSGVRSLATGLKNVAEGGVYAAEAAGEGKALLGGVLGTDKGVSFAQSISKTRGSITLADSKFAQAQGELKSNTLSQLFDRVPLRFFKGVFVENTRQLEKVRVATSSLRSLLAIVPDGIGLYGERTYLVLFQNNMELRPTGGFIGSFGLMTFNEGQLTEFKVEDIYTADGALTGHIDPPDPIAVYLEQEHWYMRDSNWDPSFTTSGARAVWFLDKELGVATDGAFAIDLAFVKNILDITGPLSVVGFAEEITGDNLFKLVHAEVHEDFFPGSTKKSDLLGALGRQLFEKLAEEEFLTKPELISALYNSFAEKHALLFFTSPQLEQVVEEIGWAGHVKPHACEREGCISDQILVVDANLGVNKSNYYLERSVSDQITIAESGEVTHELSLTYKNTAPQNDTGIGGVYKNFVRVLVPEGAELVSARVGESSKVITNDVLASKETASSEQIGGLTQFATLLEVLPGETQTLTLDYTQKGTDAEPFSYSLQIQKQPGTDKDPVAISFVYPASWQLLGSTSSDGNVAGAATVVNANKITYNTLLATDRLLNVDFAKGAN